MLKKKMHSVKAMKHRYDRESAAQAALPEEEEAMFVRFGEDTVGHVILAVVCAGLCFGALHLTNALRPGVSLSNAAIQALSAIGGGILLVEVQQNSNLTYRLYDYGRLGKDGRPRELHVDKSLDVVDLSAGAAAAVPSTPAAG